MKDQNNFNNTLQKRFSLLIAILRSRNYAAYYILWVQFLKLLCTPLDLLLATLEKMFLKGNIAPASPIIFVVGPHRSGTTFISQVLANVFPLYSLGSLNSIFYRSRYFIYKLVRYFYRKPRQPRFRSYYGLAPGLFAIGDTHEVWDQWYGGDHSTVPREISEQKVKDMQNYFAYLQKAVGRPVISKSGRNSMLIGSLHKWFPNAFFVVVNREIEYIIQSTIKADENFYGKRMAMWGLRPDSSFNPNNYSSFMEAVCQQCLQVQAKVEEQLELVPSDNYVKVSYSDFCNNPQKYIHVIYSQLNQQFSIDIEQPSSCLNAFKASKGADNKQLLTEISNMVQEIQNEWTASTD